jgi:Ferredoxin subunits of nitrite reductase and ring-hydroxylating dioxygenases
MAEKKYQWHCIAASAAELFFNDSGIAVVEVRGKKICIGRFGERLFAFAYKCPHASGIMDEGYIDAVGNVVCPVHRYKFSLQNGRNTSGEGYYLKTWPLREEEDGVYLGMESGLFGWF